VVEKPGVRGEVRARRAPDRLLVHSHQAADVLHSARDAACGGLDRGVLQLAELLLVGGQVVAEVLGDELRQHLAHQA
jgi:hypothetical protein